MVKNPRIGKKLHCLISFSSCFLLTTVSSFPSWAAPTKTEIDNHARINGFPRSDYPYYENVNGCGGEGWSDTAVRDNWGKVSFREACNNHDRCYMRLGSSLSACDDAFYNELRASCERDSYFRVFDRKVPDPATLSACYPIATTYYGSVRSVGWSWHRDAQEKAKKYNGVVQAFLQARQSPTAQTRVGYFNDGSTAFYSNGTSYCAFVSPKHWEFSRRVNQSSPSFGQLDPGRFGTYTGACGLPSGYFNDGSSVFFSAGNGTFCAFSSEQALNSHKRSRPQQPKCNVGTAVGKRDYAILCLLWDNALRRGELVQTNVRDFDPDEKKLSIFGKGRGTQRVIISLTSATVQVIADWLATREGVQPHDPLFTSFSRAYPGHRLNASSVDRMVSTKAKQAGIKKRISPHRLRHSSITSFLDASGGNVRAAQRLSRHTNLNTLQVYDDNRQDLQGEASEILASLRD